MNFGIIANIASTDTRIVQAATAEELQSKIMTALGSFNPSAQRITSITLAGAGDGHTFVAIIEGANTADCIGGLVPNVVLPGFSALTLDVRCYLAGNAEDLLIAKAAAGQPAGFANPSPPPALIPYTLIDEQVAGSSKGTRFMGMSVYCISAEDLASNVPATVAILTTGASLAAGTTFVSFDTLDNISGFSLPAAQTVRYDGGSLGSFLVDGNMTVQATNPGVIQVDVFTDPLGTPVSILGGSTITSVPAGGVAVIPFTGIAILAPTAINPARALIGVRVKIATTPAGGGNIVAGEMRLVRR